MRPRHCRGRQLSNLLSILLDCTVGTELAHPQSSQNWHLGPALFILVGFVYSLLGLEIVLEVSTNQIEVFGLMYPVDDLQEIFILSECPILDVVEHFLQLIAYDNPLALLIQFSNFQDLLRRGSKHEHVFFADFLGNLYVCSVHRADDDGSIHHVLHVARAARLQSGRRDVLWHVSCGDYFLGRAYVVVGNEDHFQAVLQVCVRVYDTRHCINQLYYLLGHHISRSSFSAKNNNSFDTFVL